MQHSIIMRFFKGIFNITTKYYKSSFTRKILNKIYKGIRHIFMHSYIYKFFTSKSKNYPKLLKNSLIGKIEGIFQAILNLLHSLYCKGVKGSSILKVENAIHKNNKRDIAKLISFIIVGIVLSFNLLSFINKNVYVFQLYVSGILLFLAINIYFIDINRLYKNSFLKRIVDNLLDFN